MKTTFEEEEAELVFVPCAHLMAGEKYLSTGCFVPLTTACKALLKQTHSCEPNDPRKIQAQNDIDIISIEMLLCKEAMLMPPKCYLGKSTLASLLMC